MRKIREKLYKPLIVSDVPIYLFPHPTKLILISLTILCYKIIIIEHSPLNMFAFKTVFKLITLCSALHLAHATPSKQMIGPPHRFLLIVTRLESKVLILISGRWFIFLGFEAKENVEGNLSKRHEVNPPAACYDSSYRGPPEHDCNRSVRNQFNYHYQHLDLFNL